MDIEEQESEQTGLVLNRDKSYTMTFSKSSFIPTCQIRSHGKLMDHVNSIVHLRSIFTSDGGWEKEVKRRIGIAKTACTPMKKAVFGKSISSMAIRLRVLTCYV